MDSTEKMICMWRITRGVPSGMHVWFDPNCESIRLYRTPTSDQHPFDHARDALDAGVGPGYLDKVDSVSASGPDRASDDSDSQITDPDLGIDQDLPF